MDFCYIGRLSNDLRCIILELGKLSLTCWDDWKEDRLQLAQDRRHWARCKDHYYGREYHPPSVLILGVILAMGVSGKFSPDVAHVIGEEAAQTLVGQEVLKGESKVIVNLLESTGSLVKMHKIKHRYP
ncbi:hypothetical protein K503DRAFT_786853 [Rhizopogon vinicolor AM-OR11-026]|uniref:Uncharacterized protein n=1 Tax=Rhizopogon vinicolor AM-OR11-026 TaxID=1314800 RepID=A0A1B7MK33_9AGAM|nr:hypothetical protein K503DRAFT_786853 [Rhizopogon vinicolor AM-OR11-026]